MSQLIHTVCMHTIDAISREKNAVTFNLGGDNPRVNCVKMALGSLEFPVTQYTVEEEWSRLHMSEDLRMTTSAASTMLIQCHVDDRHGVAMRVTFPTYNNPIVHVSHPNAQTTRISTEDPHHLWCDGVCVLRHVSWGEALLCFSSTLLLSDLASRGDLVYVDENTFDVKRRISCECGGFLHVPSPPSPLHAAQFIDSVLAIQQRKRGHSAVRLRGGSQCVPAKNEFRSAHEGDRGRISAKARVSSTTPTLKAFAPRMAWLLPSNGSSA